MLLPLAKNKTLAPRIASFCEVNLDFYMFNETVFTLNMPNLYPIFKFIEDDQADFVGSKEFKRLIEYTANKLLTVCTVYDELPNI